jgi:hypothetical protein
MLARAYAPLPPLLQPCLEPPAVLALDPFVPVVDQPFARPVLDEAVGGRRAHERGEGGQHRGQADDDRADRHVVEEAEHRHDRARDRGVERTLEAFAPRHR